jgi:hypothetical protein
MTRLAALQHLLTNVLEDTEHGKPWRLVYHALNTTNVVSFARLTQTQLESNFEWDPAGRTNWQNTRLDEGEIQTLVDIQEWIRSNKSALAADWVLKTPDQFAIFQNSPLPDPTGVGAAAQRAAVAIAPVVAVNLAPVVPITSLTAYGLKQDLKDFPEIKEHHYFNSWMDSVRTVAIMHNSDDPLDPAYVPATDIEIAIFRLHNTYMDADAAKMVKYPFGKTIIAAYKRTMDGQMTFKALTNEATGTTVRQINKNKIEGSSETDGCQP